MLENAGWFHSHQYMRLCRTPTQELGGSLLLQNGWRTRPWLALHSPATPPPSRRPTGTPRLDLQCPTPWDKNVSVGLCTVSVWRRSSCFALGLLFGALLSSQTKHGTFIYFSFDSSSTHHVVTLTICFTSWSPCFSCFSLRIK